MNLTPTYNEHYYACQRDFETATHDDCYYCDASENFDSYVDASIESEISSLGTLLTDAKLLADPNTKLNDKRLSFNQ